MGRRLASREELAPDPAHERPPSRHPAPSGWDGTAAEGLSGHAGLVMLQRLAGNAAVTALLQRQAEDAPSESGGAPLGETAQSIKADADNALGQRIELSPELVASAAGAGGDSVDYEAQAPARASQHGSAFGHDESGLDPSHVHQGVIGDCYLMAAIAAVARVNPEAIRRLIKPAGPGRYAVSLYEHRWLFADPVHTEIVDTTVPVDEHGQPLYGTGA